MLIRTAFDYIDSSVYPDRYYNDHYVPGHAHLVHLCSVTGQRLLSVRRHLVFFL